MVTLLLLTACGTDPAPVTTPAPDQDTPPAAEETVQVHPGMTPDRADPVETLPQMDRIALLRRASLDLRGRLPTLAELEAVEADRDALEPLIDTFVQDADFPTSVRNLWAPIYMTRLDYFTISASTYGLSDAAGFAASVGEEPLMILGYIAENDLPYTELVTGDWTMANELLAEAWSIDYPEDGEGWEKASYTDDRPSAGILATNGLWWRYGSTYSNANRGRANAVSKLLLCTDYLSKPIDFDRNVNLLDGGAVNDALKSNEGCVACHHSLDPLAAYFWGFYYNDIYSKLDMSTYHAEREYMYGSAVGTAPGYYGEPGYTLNDLGQQIANDSRYPACFVEQAFEQLLGRGAELEDTSTLTDLRDVFIGSGLTIRPVLAAVVDTDDYRAGVRQGGAPANTKMLSPELLASVIEDLTGFRFTYYGYDMMTTDTYGLRTLAGGVDGEFVTSPAEEATATMLLVHERLAEAAAWYVLEQDKADLENARLFTEVSFTETPSSDPDAMVAQVQALHWRLFGDRIDADGQEVEANLELWQDLYEAEGSVPDAWAGLLSVLLRDPDFLYY